jgi:hypothetical protein
MESMTNCIKDESVIERLSQNLDRITGELYLINDRLERLSTKAGVKEIEPMEKSGGEVQKSPENHTEITTQLVRRIENSIIDTHKRISELERFI